MTSPFWGRKKFHFHLFTNMKSPVTIAPFQKDSPSLKCLPMSELHASVGSLNVLSLGPMRMFAKPSDLGWMRAVPETGAL